MTPTTTPGRPVVRRVSVGEAQRADPVALLSKEWLVTNGLGGYAAGTLAGVLTRRYHGVLIAALPAPLGRLVMISHLGERVRLPGGQVHWLSGEERQGGTLFTTGGNCLRDFRLEMGLPVWVFEMDGFVLEKRVILPCLQNTVLVTYTLLNASGRLRLGLRPLLQARPHEEPVNFPLPAAPRLVAGGRHIEIHLAPELPILRLHLTGAGAFTIDSTTIPQLHYRLEESRGYEASGDAWSPGYFRTDLDAGQSVTLIASTEPLETMMALGPDEALAAERARRRHLIVAAGSVANDDTAAELVVAADQFIVAPAGRVEDAARARAAGEEARTVIAGYHWFTDWGRDTMISLEGLTLSTGRANEARHILRTFAFYLKDGLIPNLFPEGDREGLYHTADATLWFFHAIDRYLSVTDDREMLAALLPELDDSIDHHLRGTRFHIGADPDDGLLRQGEDGRALTWMDAVMGDWVVTPRRGKPVEINALWYNALRLMVDWHSAAGSTERAARLAGHAARVRDAFNRRFWYAAGHHLYDVIDGDQGDDARCRPNQIIAISLRHPVLDEARWADVLSVVQENLLTPVGLRSLAPDDPDFKPTYKGDLRTRDAAYHQGTVWAWLIGPFVDAWIRVHQADPRDARGFLKGFVPHLDEACIGSVSEIFDAQPPFHPRGCVSQAWSIAEVLRCWIKTAHPAETERGTALAP